MDGEQGVWSWWRAPLNRSSKTGRWVTVTLLTLSTALGSVLAERHSGDPFLLPDAAFYLRMAQGRMSEVQQPFASRPLAPLVARGLANALHVHIETGFALLGMASLLSVLAVVFGLATEAGAPRWFALAMACVAFWPELWHGYALPDLPYAALLGGLLFLLCAHRYTAAALWLLPLTLARESTLLVLLCLLLVGWQQLRPWRCVLAFVAAAVGSMVVRHLTAGAAGNQEHLPQALYLAGKVPWNLARTLGVVPWSNVYPQLCASPVWQLHVGMGPLTDVGVCRFSPLLPGSAGMALLTNFGLLPVLLVSSLTPKRGVIGREWARLELMPRFCVVYGAVSFVLAMALGTAYARLFGYAWPLFLVALPALLGGLQTSPEWGTESAGNRRWDAWMMGVVGIAHMLLLYLALQFWGWAVIGLEAGLWAVALVVWRVHARVTRRVVPGAVQVTSSSRRVRGRPW